MGVSGAENSSGRSPMKSPAALNSAELGGSRPGSASSPVRPVTARTWAGINGAEAPKRVSVYTNGLYGQGSVPAEEAPQQYRPASAGGRPGSARPATPRSAERLQQQLLSGAPGAGSPGRLGSPSRLQMSTANVPLPSPPRASTATPPPPVGDALDSLLARAAKAVAEDAPPAATPPAAPAPAAEASSAPAPTAAPASAEHPLTAPVRSAAVSLAALKLQAPDAPLGSVPGARDSPRARQLFQGFAGSTATPRAALGSAAGARNNNLAAAPATAQQQRPCTPSFQPVSAAARPATAMADFTIKSGMQTGSNPESRAPAAAAEAVLGGSPLRRPYPLPPSTAPAKADVKDAAQRDGLASYGIVSAAFVAAPAKTAGTRAGRGGEIEEAADEPAGGTKAPLKAMLQADMLASAAVGGEAGLRRFLLTPGPTDKPLQCKIFRTRPGFMKSHSQYVLVLEDGGRFLLAGSKSKGGGRGAKYTISIDKDNAAHKGPSVCGRLHSSFLGTEFVCYDGGEKPRAGDSISARCQLGAVAYQPNVLGTKGPRKMTVLIPKLDPAAAASRPLKLQPGSDREAMLARYKQYDLKDMVVLRNKPPKWNDALSAYCLNFGGRVTQASVKNFQLVSVDNMERIILQFGKVGADEFTMDYAYPMTALQAFAICLSSFHSKLACE